VSRPYCFMAVSNVHPGRVHCSDTISQTRQPRLVLHKDGYAELYDHTSAAGETLNVADAYESAVEELTAQLRERLSLRE